MDWELKADSILPEISDDDDFDAAALEAAIRASRARDDKARRRAYKDLLNDEPVWLDDVA